ncbi:MAG: creatininase family protein [Thermoplasmata archaeon]|jgi:creatinine amidohydrolase|nr:creatininase family protein [Thermoplasmata archaeon]
MSGRAARKPILLENLTSTEFARLAKRKPLAIVPFGSVEEHGSHLPLCTDSFQAEEVARRVALAFDAILCPPIRYGECRTTRNFPGTLSLTSETVRGLSYDIVTELARNGIDKVMILSGHAGSGHMAALRLGAQRAVEQHPKLKVMVLSDYDIAYDLRGKEFAHNDGHGGEIETSRLLNICPETVRRSRPRGSSRPPEYMILVSPEDHFPTGIIGDSSLASADKGLRIDDYVVDKLVKLASRNFGIRRK